MALHKLTPAVHEKVWGSHLTELWLENAGRRKIGEIWFSAPEALPVLVKLLFTSERLSVQVHPNDTYARAHGHERGKTEMWHILRAEPGSVVALGLREKISGERVREAALSGEIVDLLEWVPARAGDTFFVPAGTIHAIGAGLVLCEIQQHSDVTYRLFDYQRKPKRELHLDDSLAVASLVPYDGRCAGAEGLLAECDYFRTEKLCIQGTVQYPVGDRPAICIAIEGEGRIDGEPFRAGEAWLASGNPSLQLESGNAAFIIASSPAL